MVNLKNVIRAMSLALDLTQISGYSPEEVVHQDDSFNTFNHGFLHHSKRTNFIAISIGNHLKLSENQLKELYVSSLLHDIGATSSLKSSHNIDAYIKNHSKAGAEIIRSFPYFHNIGDNIMYHHENYDGTGAFGLKGNEIPFLSQIIRISDLVEISFEENKPAFLQSEKILNWVKNNSGHLFSKEISDAFLSISKADMFWFDMETISVMEYLSHIKYPTIDIDLNLQEFMNVAYIFSKIIDSKSKFTAEHSYGISELAYRVSKHLNYDEEKCLKMKIAGLLHDVGKLAIPNVILDKPGSLTKEEFSLIKSHSYYTKIILDTIEGIEDISYWASNHHEKLNGTGYPRLLNKDSLDECSRIMAVCDVYQALTEDRPYRKGLEQKKAFEILYGMVEDEHLCKYAVESLKETLKLSF